MPEKCIKDYVAPIEASVAQQLPDQTKLTKMKSMILVALALVAVAVAVPVEVEPVKILRSEFEQQPEGGYVQSFESEDGIQRLETGEVKEVLNEENKPQKVVVVRGSYSYPRADGTIETVNYFADETGFHAEGESIPKPNSR